MKKNNELKVALITESLWGMGGANRTLEAIAEIYPNSDIYALFGNLNKVSRSLSKHRVIFSYLNKRPFIKTLYRYTYHLWPHALESFNLNSYDLVISSSSSVAFGVVTPMTCKHVAYIHSPMRYLWDIKDMGTSSLGPIRRVISNMLLVPLRMWDVSASSRPDILVANSEFVSKRVEKYWRRDVDYVLTPPITFYNGEIKKERKPYIVAGAPFEFNKKGDFLLKCIASTDINLKLIGTGSMFPRLKRKYRKCKNIEFLGIISDEQKWELFANASCFVMPGIEDYGIFPVEAMSAGVPVLGYKGGGILENLKEGINGYFFDEWNEKIFLDGLKKVLNTNWNHEEIAKSVRGNNNGKEEFKKKLADIVQNSTF